MSDSNLTAYKDLPVQRVALHGTPIHYRIIGNGPPLLMIHGWPLCGATFREYIARMQTRWTCIVPDLPGSGSTPWDPNTENMLEDWGALMAEFVDALGFDTLSILAHDSGGTIARVMAAQCRDRIRSLVIANTEISGHSSKRLLALQAGMRLPGARRLLSKLIASRRFRRSEGGFGGCFSDLDVLDAEFHDACIAPLIEDATGAHLAFTHIDLSTTERLAAIHQKMTAPTLLVWGEEDPFFPLPDAVTMLKEFPAGSALEVIPQAKLFVHEERPKEVMALAEPFLAKHLH